MKIDILNKIKIRIRSEIINFSKDFNWYPLIYKSYWHLKFNRRVINHENNKNYLTAQPNTGAGIGHQLANWIAGYYFSKKFFLKFAHSNFSSPDWEFFLSLGSGEILSNQLIYHKDYKKVVLPLFDEFNKKDIDLIKKIIKSYSNKKVVFFCEQDQFHKDQFTVIKSLKNKFHNSKARKNDILKYKKDECNIAVHIRRGDIVETQGKIKNHTMRWLNNSYFLEVIENTLKRINTNKKINIFIFSQGSKHDYNDFLHFENLNLCLEMSPIDSFLHMLNADILITSKSSFSYKAALFSNGIKICPINFWHGYPSSSDWVLVDNNGIFNTKLNFDL